jgi:hypothetical protein
VAVVGEEVLRRPGQQARPAAADLAVRRRGHRVADVHAEEVVPAAPGGGDEGDRVAAVVGHDPASGVHHVADQGTAIGVVAIEPPPVGRRSRRVEGALEERQQLLLVARRVGAHAEVVGASVQGGEAGCGPPARRREIEGAQDAKALLIE